MDNERIKALEVQMKELIGNGQPGRVGRLEDRMDRITWLTAVGVGLLLAFQVLAANGLLTFLKH